MDPRLRDFLLVIGGLAIMAHQTLVAKTASPTLVGAALAMMFGAPVAYRVFDRLLGPAKGEDKP